jgi:hypothetical protein
MLLIFFSQQPNRPASLSFSFLSTFSQLPNIIFQVFLFFLFPLVVTVNWRTGFGLINNGDHTGIKIKKIKYNQ